MVPVPSTSYSWNTAAINSRSSLLRDCHPPCLPLRMRLAAAARFRLSLYRTLSGLTSSCTMTAMVPALEKFQPSETLGLLSGETLSVTRESTSARVSLGGGVRRQVSVIIRLVRRACACASPRDASEISQRHIPPPLPKKLHWRAVYCLGPALRFPPGNPRAAEPRAQLDPPAPTRLPSDHRSADRDVRPLRFQGAFASATRRTRARVFRSSSPRRGREGCPRSVADAPLSDPHPTITPASPPASSPQSFLVTLLLFICTCTYVKMKAPQLMDPYRTGLRGLFWKAARIGERLSPWVSVSCLAFGAHTFWTGGK